MSYSRSRIASRSAITIVILGSLSGAAPDAPSEAADSSVVGRLSVKIQARETTCRQLEAVVVDYEIKPVGIPEGTTWFFSDYYPLSPNLSLHVRRDGDDVSSTAFSSIRWQHSGLGKLRFLRRNSVVKGHICVNLLYDMTIPGRYTISLDAAVGGHREKSVPRVKSNEIEVLVQGGPL